MTVKEISSLQAWSGHSRGSYLIWNQVPVVSCHWNRLDKDTGTTALTGYPISPEWREGESKKNKELIFSEHMMQGLFIKVLLLKAFMAFPSQLDSCCWLSNLLLGDLGSLAIFYVHIKFLCSPPFPFPGETLILNSLFYWAKKQEIYQKGWQNSLQATFPLFLFLLLTLFNYSFHSILFCISFSIRVQHGG